MNIQLFNIAPAIPEKLRFLEELCHNMWWCWHPDAIELFRRINPQLWRESGHNPLEFLVRVPQKRLESLAEDEGYLEHVQQVQSRFGRLRDPDRIPRPDRAVPCVGYFSLEYGIHETLTMYSGGLGVLAGDHLKASSDLKVPLVAVGLFYRQGYFRQFLNADGWQQERYPEHELHYLPLTRAHSPDGQEVHIAIPCPGGTLRACVWRMDVGRVPLFLLDTNIPENPPELRGTTAQLYAADRTQRLRQELLLGIGGFRALTELGYDPHVCHINEGHAAFLSLARVPHLIKRFGVDLETAMEIIPRTTVFTTHTPVPAGNETYHVDLARPYLSALEKEIGVPVERVLSLAQPDGSGSHGEISMTVLALRLAQFSCGVSRLHGRVARRMWAPLWPGRPEDEVPITHVTNGVHVRSWLSPDNSVIYERYLGPDWHRHPADARVLANVTHIPDEELWRTHEINRSRLVRMTRESLERQLSVRNAPRTEIAAARSMLDHDTLTIGFARRFATYKRANLLLRDPERLEALLTNEDRPVQIIFAGKSHPADNYGKDFIRQIVQFSRRPKLRNRIVFLEDYDINMARYLVQGVDVWLNCPRRPQEACGTSGMKAAANGVMNLSVLDGWWCEAYHPDCGWAIGHGEEYDDAEYQDTVESHALYNLLENEIVPCFYECAAGDIPVRWLAMMKASIRMALTFFTSHRMVAEYDERFYRPAMEAFTQLTGDNAAQARKLVAQHARLRQLWRQISVSLPHADREVSVMHVGDRFNVKAQVHLGDIRPEEVAIQVYFGPVDSQNRITQSHVQTMTLAEGVGHGRHTYQAEIECQSTGRFGLTARAIPAGRDWQHAMPGFITWANDEGSV